MPCGVYTAGVRARGASVVRRRKLPKGGGCLVGLGRGRNTAQNAVRWCRMRAGLSRGVADAGLCKHDRYKDNMGRGSEAVGKRSASYRGRGIVSPCLRKRKPQSAEILPWSWTHYSLGSKLEGIFYPQIPL